jgi:hypothetical protein
MIIIINVHIFFVDINRKEGLLSINSKNIFLQMFKIMYSKTKNQNQKISKNQSERQAKARVEVKARVPIEAQIGEFLVFLIYVSPN